MSGLAKVEIPELGPASRGKVRDNWILNKDGIKIRVMVTTDRQAVFAKPVCTILGKGQISNLISAFWFDLTKDIVPNHMLAVPHPNVLIARQARAVIPIEIVARRYLAVAASETSLYVNYFQKNRRRIYGLEFPDGLKPNQELPHTILTPTTKAKNGHDQELTQIQAKNLADNQFGSGSWDQISQAALAIFEKARKYCLDKGLILADTKMEFGLDQDGQLMLIDELLTPECSRYLSFDKEVLTKYLMQKGFTGKGRVPFIEQDILAKMYQAYSRPYELITGRILPTPETDPQVIRQAVLKYFS